MNGFANVAERPGVVGNSEKVVWNGKYTRERDGESIPDDRTKAPLLLLAFIVLTPLSSGPRVGARNVDKRG